MSAAPHLTNGAPDGTEAISGLQTLARAYVNAAGQTVTLDNYFNLSGLAYTTAVMGTRRRQLLPDAVRLRQPGPRGPGGQPDGDDHTHDLRRSRAHCEPLGRHQRHAGERLLVADEQHGAVEHGAGGRLRLRQRRRGRREPDAGDGLPRRKRGQPRDAELVRLARPPGGEQVGRAGERERRREPADPVHHLRQPRRTNRGAAVHGRRRDAHDHQRRAAAAGGQPAARPGRDELRRPGPRLPDAGLRREPDDGRRLGHGVDDQRLLRPPRRPDRHVGAGRSVDEEPVRRRRPGRDGLHHRRRRRNDLGGGGQRGQRHGAGADADRLRRRQQRDRNHRQPALPQRDGDGAAGDADERRRGEGLLRRRLLRQCGSSDGHSRCRHQRRHGLDPAGDAAGAVRHGAGDDVWLQRRRLGAGRDRPARHRHAHPLRQPRPHRENHRRLHRQPRDGRVGRGDGVHLRRGRQRPDGHGRRAERRLPAHGLRLRRDDGLGLRRGAKL